MRPRRRFEENDGRNPCTTKASHKRPPFRCQSTVVGGRMPAAIARLTVASALLQATTAAS